MSETACVSGLELLVDYLEGLLPPPTVAAIEGHVAGCRKCQAFIASYNATPRILREATETEMPVRIQTSLLDWLRKKRS